MNNDICQTLKYCLNHGTKPPSVCNLLKYNKTYSHCNINCKNYFISHYKVKTGSDTKTRASFCIIYKIINDSIHILVHKRKFPLKTNKNQYFIPGGKVEVGETYKDAVIREIEEETGISISQSHYSDNLKTLSNINTCTMIFGLQVPDKWGRNLITNHHEFENNSYTWVDINNIKKNNYSRQYTSLQQVLNTFKIDDLQS